MKDRSSPGEQPRFVLRPDYDRQVGGFGPEPESWLVWRVDANCERDLGQPSFEVSHVGMTMLHRLKKPSGILASLDPYGETVLARHELAEVIQELEEMVRAVRGEDATKALNDFVGYLRESEELAASVCFCGD